MDRDQTYKMKKELIAPVYNVDENEQINHFKEVVMHAEMIRVLQVRDLSEVAHEKDYIMHMLFIHFHFELMFFPVLRISSFL